MADPAMPDIWVQMLEAEKEQVITNAETAKTFRKLLTEQGVSRVTATYDGSGDSGNMEELTKFEHNGRDGLEAVTPELDNSIIEKLRDLLWSVLHSKHGGWENNDGASGSIVFDVDAAEIRISHDERYMETRNIESTVEIK